MYTPRKPNAPHVNLRDRYVYVEVCKGRTFVNLSTEMHVSTTRVRAMYLRYVSANKKGW